MAQTITITIDAGCTPDQKTQHCVKTDQICFFNNTGKELTIVFDPPGSPLMPPTIGPIDPGTQKCGDVAGGVGTYNYHCAGATPIAPLTNGGGGGIIIVDPGTGNVPPPKKPKKEASAKPAAKSPKAKSKAKPKAKSKTRPKGKGKAKAGGKKAAPKRKAGKLRSKK